MAPQHVETAETIAALKRALRREREAPADEAIHSATNRGNKLQRGAAYVHAGALPYPQGPGGYRQKIEHAGYTRYILERNPKRFNEYGDELEDSESDAEADVDAQDENPYSNIHLEKLLRPLTDPAELATHPTLSQAFLDPALPSMIDSTEAKLRQERANLWRAKNMNRLFMGDESWVPLETVEATVDWDLFEPKPDLPALHPNKRRKRDDAQNASFSRGANGLDPTDNDLGEDTPGNRNKNTTHGAGKDGSRGHKNKPHPPDQDEPMESVEQPPPEEVDMIDDDHPQVNGKDMGDDGDSNQNPGDSGSKNKSDNIDDHNKDSGKDAMDVDGEQQDDDDDDDDDDDGSGDGSPPPPPTRRITRALAAEQEGSDRGSPAQSDSTTDSDLLQPDPLFLLPPGMYNSTRHTSRFASQLGLPAEEFLETRRLLTLYIQKQEESVRGYEALLGKLIKARRMRDRLFEWCKAEGAGEMSDGEDWVDEAFWGLTEGELRKGRDEEEQPVEEEGRKGKRRGRRD